MDDTQKRRFRWIADHSVYIFWTIWGGGVGATLTVFSGAVDVGGDVLRVYLGILTTMMAGIFGIVSARAMDNRTDRRRIRRRLYSARTRVRDLVDELERLDVLCQEIKSTKAVHSAGRNLTYDEASNVLVRCSRIHARSVEAPDFEDIVETEGDANAEIVCRSNFLFCRDLFDFGKLSEMDTGARQKKAATFILHIRVARTPHSPGDALTSVITHIQRRLDQEA